MQVLLVSDLHYDLRKLDWVLDQAGEQDVLVLAGDLLDIASAVPLDAQIAVLQEYLARMAARTSVVVCSGNHDLDHRDASGEKATGWLAACRAAGVHVDGDGVQLGAWLLTSCAWWEGPATLAALEARLEAAAGQRTDRWLWVWHGPPDGPLAWTGSRRFGDPELPRLVERHRPDVVLCGHIHQAPFVEGGAWRDQQGNDVAVQRRAPARSGALHVLLDLEAGRARWWSYAGTDEVDLALAPAQ